MNVLKTPFFIFCSVLFLMHQVAQLLLRISVPLADNYLDNLLAMPIILSLLQAERRHLFNKGLHYRVPLFEILLATAYVSLVSEWIFPLMSHRFTSDRIDLVFFFTGAAAFYFLQNGKKAHIDSKV